MRDAEIERLNTGLKLMEIELAEEAVYRLSIYFRELKKWNRKVNLIARRATDSQIIENHFLDSLTLLPFVRQAGLAGLAGLLDIGAGAGFPGLVLKAACPRLEVTLVEPRQKRVFFLNHVIRTLQLEGVTVVAARLNGKGPPPFAVDRSFAIVTSRALTDISSFMEMAARFCSASGLIICMKGPQGLAEIKSFQKKEEEGPCRLTEVREWRLPFSKAVRLILVFSKIGGPEAGGTLEGE